MKVVRNNILSNLYLDDKLPILHCSSSGNLKSYQTPKFDDFLDQHQHFLRAKRGISQHWIAIPKLKQLELLYKPLGLILLRCLMAFKGASIAPPDTDRRDPCSLCRNNFGILLNQNKIRLYLSFSDWIGTKRNCVWFQINWS